jgi:hypothetical protein
MKLKDILAISGQQGLFKFVSKGRTGIIVESLLDGRRSSVGMNAKANSLADIVLIAAPKDIPLAKILYAIRDKNNSAASLDAKTASADELTALFTEIAPDYDRSKVHLSDMKKIVAWYNLLQQCGLLDFEVDEEENDGKPADKNAAPTSATHKPTPQNVPKPSNKAAGTSKISIPRKAQ